MSESTVLRRVIILRGTMASGKTALQGMLASGDMHLVDVPVLREAVEEGYTFVHIDQLAGTMDDSDFEWGDLRGGEDKPNLIVDACVHAQEVAAAFPDAEVVSVGLVAPRHILAARRKMRFIAQGIAPCSVEQPFRRLI